MAAPTNDDHDHGLDLLRALRDLGSQADEVSRALVDELGVTVPQLLCMTVIAEANPAAVTVAEISDAVDLAPSTVSGILDRLERAKMVRRRRSRSDRRQVHLSITPVGRERLGEMPDLGERLQDHLRGLDGAERRRAAKALRTLLAVVEDDA